MYAINDVAFRDLEDALATAQFLANRDGRRQIVRTVSADPRQDGLIVAVVVPVEGLSCGDRTKMSVRLR